jgi:hypothetical protein
VPEGLQDYWTNVASNITRRLHHGYCVTRLAADSELNFSWTQLRQKEREFYQLETSVKWRNPKISTGVPTLTEALSNKLCEMTQDR